MATTQDVSASRTPPGVRPEASRRRMTAQDLALIATFAALVAVLGMAGSFYVPGSPVPITLQTLGVALAGAVLGWKRGLAAVTLFIVMVAVGLPLLAGGRAGPAVFAGPTVGYLLGWLPAVAVIGFLVQTRLPRAPFWWVFVSCVAGSVIIHACGIAGMMARAGLSFTQAVSADALFLPGDLIKATLAALIASSVHRAVPGLTPGRRH